MATSAPLLKTPSASDAHTENMAKKNQRFGDSGTLAQEMETGLIFLREVSPASHSAAPDEEKERQTTASSGRKCYELYASFLPTGSSVRMLVASLLGTTAWYSGKRFLRWKARGTKSKHLLFRLVPSTHRIEGTEYGLLATTKSGKRGPDYAKIKRSKTGISLETAITMLPTPAARDYKSDVGNQSDEELYGKKGKPLPRIISGGKKTGLKLQPAFVEYMMGYPQGWTDLNSPKQSIGSNG